MGAWTMNGNTRSISLNGRTITLVGTAHISKESIAEVEETIRRIRPDCTAIELDEKRAESLLDHNRYMQLDIIKVLKRHEGFLLLANLVLSSFQRRMGQNVGVRPGDEMLAAMKVSEELGIPTVMADRPVQVTLKRAWNRNTLWGKCKLLSSLLASAFSKEEISGDQIEKIKKGSEMDAMLAELSDYMPVIKEVLIDERDRYLAAKIWDSQGGNVVAVLGAGHIAGVEAHLNRMAAGKETTDVSQISEIPPKSAGAKIVSWIIPVLIIGLIAAGFIYGGSRTGGKMVLSWILWNSVPAALMSLIAGAHPLTIITAFAGAPLTSLCPFIGIGFLTAAVQAFCVKPKVSDMETIQDDVSSVKGFYRNRILRILLIFILSSIGSSLGTFIGGADIIKSLGGIR